MPETIVACLLLIVAGDHVREGPRVISVQTHNFGPAHEFHSLTIQFSPEHPLDKPRAENWDNYVLRPSDGTGDFDRGAKPPIGKNNRANGSADKTEFDPARNVVVLKFKNLTPDIYRLEIASSLPGNLDRGIADINGNSLARITHRAT